MPSLDIPDESAWHAIRAKHVGASEVAALFNLSPWMTLWQLHMLKCGKLPDVFESSSMTQGKHFEPAVASYAQEKFGIRLRKVRRYLTHDTVKLGASLDYEEFGGGALIPTELKFSLWGDGWEYDGDELTQIPEYYLLQVQAQLACSPAAPHGQLIAFTGGDLKRMVIPRSHRLIDAVVVATMKFWDDVASETEPPIDFNADADAVNRLAYISKLRSVILQPEMEPVFAAYDKARTERLAAEKLEEAKKTELLKAIIDAGEGNDTCVATCMGWKMKVVKIAENPGREIVAADVGTRVGAKKGHNRLYVSNEADK